MKIIDPLINANINITRKGFFYSNTSHNYKTLPVEQTEVLIDFTIERARSSHAFRIKQICEVTLSSAIARAQVFQGVLQNCLKKK